MARIPVGIYSLLFLKNSADATAKDAPVWPDGNEKSLGLAIRSSIAVLISKGLVLATRGLMITLHKRASKARDKATVRPSFLVFGIMIRIKASNIQTMPRLAIKETAGKKTSPKPFLN